MTKKILVIEPFYGGSHKQLIDFLMTLNLEIQLVSFPAKKWHWRARTSALTLSQVIEKSSESAPPPDILFCSSVLNLCELVSLRPDLSKIPLKIVYFHENQLSYPVQTIKERDFQYGYNQILTCLTADKVLFNSAWNFNSFLDQMSSFFKIQPADSRPDIQKLKEDICQKSHVLYFPIKLLNYQPRLGSQEVLHIVWPHRWEHDKNPSAFFDILFRLQDEKFNFVVSILGENFQEIPQIFLQAKDILGAKILHFGYLESKNDYIDILQKAHVVVSTSNHEFFGVAMLEAASAGCLPLVPNRLVYPELYPKEPCLYSTDNQLYKKLKVFCQKPYLAQVQWSPELAEKTCQRYSTDHLAKEYIKHFE